MLKIADFESFKISNPIKISGGESGICTGSSMVNGKTYVDIAWEGGSTTCGPDSGFEFSGDSGSDRLIGEPFSR